MRFIMYRGPGVALFLVCAAAAATAQPPSVLNKLRADTAALATERSAAESNSAERERLQADLRRLLERLDKDPPRVPMNPPPPPVPTKKGETTGSTGTGAAVDPLRAAMNLISDNQFEAALNAFRQLDLERLAPDDRAFAKFMTASCLRRLGQTTDALRIYRDVGNAGEEPFISSAAVSQVSQIRTSEELQAQLIKLRDRPKAR